MFNPTRTMKAEKILSLMEKHAQAKKELNSLRRSYFDLESQYGQDSKEAISHAKLISKYRKLATKLENQLSPRADKTATSLRYS